MTSIYELPSWSRDELTDDQKHQFRTTAVGESFHSLRTTFEVQCNKCGATLHSSTNNPSFYIDMHQCKISGDTSGDTSEFSSAEGDNKKGEFFQFPPEITIEKEGGRTDGE